jgi:hypothetical protein
MGLAIVTIADSIAALSISGVTIKDLDEIPEKVESRDCPILYPEPDGFISGFGMDVQSFGPGSVAAIDVTYNLRYTFLHSSLGTGRGLFDVYSDMVAKVVLILNAVLTNDAITGLQDFRVAEITNFGPVTDPAASMTFHGTQFVFRVMELWN